MTLIAEPAYGTPAVAADSTVCVTVDGCTVEVPAGTSVLRAASLAGVDVPRLCATDSLKAFGSCRLCLVEVDGMRGTPASCTTPCTDAMVVSTQTEQVRDLRRGVMELYLSDHPADCAGCARGSLVVVQDLFLNETARFAHVFLPGTSFLEKDGTFTNAERRINRVRPVMAPAQGRDEWQIVCDIAAAMGYPMSYGSSAEIMDEIAATTPTFAGVSFARLDAMGSLQWPVTDHAPEGTPIMHVDGFVRGKGRFIRTVYVPTTERTTRRYPLILTTGRILTQYNVGAQTRRTDNSLWHPEDVLEIHPADAQVRGIASGDLVELASRVGTTTLRALVSERLPPGVVYTTFHHPVTGANVVTTENSDWATNCPEYKVTAVQVAAATARDVGAQSGTRHTYDVAPAEPGWLAGDERARVCRRADGARHRAPARPPTPRRPPRRRLRPTSRSSGSRGCARSSWRASGPGT